MIDLLGDIVDLIFGLVSMCSNGLKEGIAIVSGFFESVISVQSFLPAVLVTAFGCAVAFRVIMRVI